MFRRILVTLDGSEFAEAALPAASALARRSGGELRLLLVRDPEFEFATDAGWVIEGEETPGPEIARRYLDSKRVTLAAACPKVTTALRTGYPTDEILAEAEAFDADLLVMATHGHGGMTRLWLGSVANHCVRHGNRSVMLIRPNGGKADAVREGSLGLHHVLVPLDGSELAERALGSAAVFANLFGSPVTLMRTVHDLTVADPEFFPEAVERTQAMVDHDVGVAKAYLERVAQPLREWGLRVETVVTPSPEAAPAILEKADRRLIVMATHARTGIGRALFGSVTEEVVHGAHGPVLVVPPDAPTARAVPPWLVALADPPLILA